METAKKAIVTILQVILWLTFTLAIGDPLIIGLERTPGSFIANYAGMINPLYQILDGYLLAPIKSLFQMVSLYNPNAPDTWFPVASAPELSQLMTGFGMGSVFTPTLFPGGFIMWIPIASIALTMASLAFDRVYEQARNLIWNVVIEYIFQRKKARMYAKALDQRTAEMNRLNNQYRALAQETHSLKDSVITDELTKVFNKRFFLNRLQQEFDTCVEEKAVLSIIMIDIDFFKKLNDTYGHLAGDTVLKAVSAVLKRFVPDQCYPCRYGGEEFSVIMPRRSLSEAIEAARLLQENVQQLRFEDIDPKLRVTISQGICTVDFACIESRQIKQFDQMLQLADQELYRSKMEGRNRVSSHCIQGAKF